MKLVVSDPDDQKQMSGLGEEVERLCQLVQRLLSLPVDDRFQPDKVLAVQELFIKSNLIQLMQGPYKAQVASRLGENGKQLLKDMDQKYKTLIQQRPDLKINSFANMQLPLGYPSTMGGAPAHSGGNDTPLNNNIFNSNIPSAHFSGQASRKGNPGVSAQFAFGSANRNTPRNGGNFGGKGSNNTNMVHNGSMGGRFGNTNAGPAFGNHSQVPSVSNQNHIRAVCQKFNLSETSTQKVLGIVPSLVIQGRLTNFEQLALVIQRIEALDRSTVFPATTALQNASHLLGNSNLNARFDGLKTGMQTMASSSSGSGIAAAFSTNANTLREPQNSLDDLLSIFSGTAAQSVVCGGEQLARNSAPNTSVRSDVAPDDPTTALLVAEIFGATGDPSEAVGSRDLLEGSTALQMPLASPLPPQQIGGTPASVCVGGANPSIISTTATGSRKIDDVESPSIGADMDTRADLNMSTAKAQDDFYINTPEFIKSPKKVVPVSGVDLASVASIASTIGANAMTSAQPQSHINSKTAIGKQEEDFRARLGQQYAMKCRVHQVMRSHSEQSNEKASPHLGSVLLSPPAFAPKGTHATKTGSPGLVPSASMVPTFSLSTELSNPSLPAALEARPAAVAVQQPAEDPQIFGPSLPPGMIERTSPQLKQVQQVFGPTLPPRSDAVPVQQQEATPSQTNSREGCEHQNDQVTQRGGHPSPNKVSRRTSPDKGSSRTSPDKGSRRISTESAEKEAFVLPRAKKRKGDRASRSSSSSASRSRSSSSSGSSSSSEGKKKKRKAKDKKKKKKSKKEAFPSEPTMSAFNEPSYENFAAYTYYADPANYYAQGMYWDDYTQSYQYANANAYYYAAGSNAGATSCAAASCASSKPSRKSGKSATLNVSIGNPYEGHDMSTTFSNNINAQTSNPYCEDASAGFADGGTFMLDKCPGEMAEQERAVAMYRYWQTTAKMAPFLRTMPASELEKLHTLKYPPTSETDLSGLRHFCPKTYAEFVNKFVKEERKNGKQNTGILNFYFRHSFFTFHLQGSPQTFHLEKKSKSIWNIK